jgi:putative NADPH-quinone reductase
MSSRPSNKPSAIIALACSPSKGFNSDTMLDAFLSGVAEVKKVTYEKIYLSDLNIANYSFFNRIPDPVKEPEMFGMVEKIMQAKGVVIATPCFNFNVPAALKNLLDRLSYKALDPKRINWLGQPTGQFNHLHNFYLVSCGTKWWMIRLGLWPIFPMFWLRVVFWYFGAKTWGGIYGAGLNAQKLAKDNQALLSRCRRAGRRYAERIAKL